MCKKILEKTIFRVFVSDAICLKPKIDTCNLNGKINDACNCLFTDILLSNSYHQRSTYQILATATTTTTKIK